MCSRSKKKLRDLGKLPSFKQKVHEGMAKKKIKDEEKLKVETSKE